MPPPFGAVVQPERAERITRTIRSFFILVGATRGRGQLVAGEGFDAKEHLRLDKNQAAIRGECPH